MAIVMNNPLYPSDMELIEKWDHLLGINQMPEHRLAIARMLENQERFIPVDEQADERAAEQADEQHEQLLDEIAQEERMDEQHEQLLDEIAQEERMDEQHEQMDEQTALPDEFTYNPAYDDDINEEDEEELTEIDSNGNVVPATPPSESNPLITANTPYVSNVGPTNSTPHHSSHPHILSYFDTLQVGEMIKIWKYIYEGSHVKTQIIIGEYKTAFDDFVRLSNGIQFPLSRTPDWGSGVSPRDFEMSIGRVIRTYEMFISLHDVYMVERVDKPKLELTEHEEARKLDLE